jgi:RNA polymerase sigma factor (sigma-70 family)
MDETGTASGCTAERQQIARITRRAAAGDQAAWGELIDRYSRLLWAIAAQHRLGGADAADVFQTTWLRLVEHVGRLSDPARVGAWLATTARRECLRVLRASGRQVPVGDDLPEIATHPDLDEQLVRADRDATLWQAFSCLRPRDQELLLMLVAESEPSYDDIAVALDMPIGSIGPTRGRSLRQLRREFERLEAQGCATVAPTGRRAATLAPRRYTATSRPDSRAVAPQ